MENGYIEAKSDSLPVMDHFMISVFFIDNMNYLSAEVRSVKNLRATRDSYGDHAVGYVQLKRENNICIVKSKITPEHKVRAQAYNVTIKIDEADSKIISSECHDCVASCGGCKHAIAFLYWLLRRSEEPSPTSVECYWKKALLSKVGTSVKLLKATDLKPGEPENFTEKQGFLEKAVEKAVEEKCGGNIVKYFTPETSLKKLSMHYLGLSYFKNTNDPTVQSFVDYCKSEMSENVCKQAAKETCSQYKSHLWYELRYARITASKIYEASTCSKMCGSLFEQILGAVCLPDTEPMKRGRELEDSVLQVVAEEKNIKLSKTGLILDKCYPMLGASPDAISDYYVIEVKCPSSEKNFGNYIGKSNNINKKYLSQIQLQMMFCNKNKGLFCIADHNFETTKKVTIIEVEYDKNYIESVIFNAVKFWENAIYPALVK